MECDPHGGLYARVSIVSGDPRVEVLVTHRNDVPALRNCLDSLRPQTLVPQVCVIDDASTDDTPQVVPRDYPEVRYLRLEENVGFGRALDRGAKSSAAPLVLFLNNDTVCDARFVERTLHAHERSGAAMVAPVLRRRDGRIDTAGIELLPSLVSFDALHGEPYTPAASAGLPLLAPCGGAGLFERERFLAVGGFDPRIDAYLEDVDLGIRMALAGAHCEPAPDAFAWHMHSSYWGSGTARKNFRMGRSRGYLEWKYRPDVSAADRWRGRLIDLVVYSGQVLIDRNAAAFRGRLQARRDHRGEDPGEGHAEWRRVRTVALPVHRALARRLARRR